MKNPNKNIIVEAFWISICRTVRAKWTGKRWLRLNESCGGYDPVKEIPIKWRYLDNYEIFS